MKKEPIQKTKGHTNLGLFPPRFFYNLIFQKWSILIILSFILALLLAPQLNVNHPKFAVGMVLDFDIRATHDFLVEDKLATERKKIEAARNVEPVFNYDLNAPDAIGAKLTKAFSFIEEQYYRTDSKNKDDVNRLTRSELPKKIKSDFEQLLGISLSDLEFAILHKHEFSQSICSGTIQLLQTFKGDSNDYEDLPEIR